MPIVEIRQLSAHTRMGLWRMDESPQQLCEQFPHLQSLDMPFRNDGRQREYLSVRALLFMMTGREDLRIAYAPSGKPLLDGFELSISHTKGYAVLILSTCEAVAIDIEWRTDRVGRIAHKFIAPDEDCDSIDDMLLLWSAKETLYKLHSEDKLDYFDMRQLSKDSHCLYIENKKRKIAVSIFHEMTDDYALTYTYLSQTE